MAPVLAVEDLTTVFDLRNGPAPAVAGFAIELFAGETLSLVGESGCGKSVAVRSILGLVQPPGRRVSGRVLFQGRDLAGLGPDELRRVRGAAIGYVPQEPAAALNPVFTIGDQIAEVLVVHGRANAREGRRRAVGLLHDVRIGDATRRVNDYPHQFSGGERQRLLLAMALACEPALLIADEPTTALDPTTAADVLDVLAERQRALGLAVLLVTHDLGLVATRANRVAVMYAGRIVEDGPTAVIFRDARHPYTRGLLASMPGRRIRERRPAMPGAAPTLGNLPSGCPFHPRCPDRLDACSAALPTARVVGDGHVTRCVLEEPHVRADA